MKANIPIICQSARILAGLTFVISGLTKSLNIFDTSLKVQEYFEALNMLTYNWLYDIIAGTLITIELSVGLLLTFGLFVKKTIKVSFALILFFTVLTFYTYNSNYIQECGCFGQVFSLTIKETLFKNIILLFVCTVALCAKSYYKKHEILYTVISFAISFAGGFYGLFIQPLYDTSAYRIGKAITNEELDVEIEEVDSMRQYFKKEKINEEKSYIALIIVRDLNNINKNKIKDIEEKIRKKAYINRGDIILLTSTPLNSIEKSMHFICIGNIDNNLSKKIIQSNLGVIILKGGVIRNKWQQNSLFLQKFSIF